MANKFYIKRVIEQEAVHDDDSKIYATQKAKELDWDTFKASKSFINMFKKENQIPSRRYNKVIIRPKSDRKSRTLSIISRI